MPFGATTATTFSLLLVVTLFAFAAAAAASGDAAVRTQSSADRTSSNSHANSSSSSSVSFRSQSAADLYDRLMDVEFGAEAAAMTRRPRRSPIYQNEFAVYIPSGDAAADEVAAKHGFSNEGQVRADRVNFFSRVCVCVFCCAID